MLSINLSFEHFYSLKIHPKFCRPIFESWVRDMKKSLRSFFISGQSYTCTLNKYTTWNSHFQWTLTTKVYKLSLLSYFQHLYQEKNYSRRIWKTIQLLWPPTATLSFLIMQDLNLIWSGKKSVFISSAQCYSLGNVCLWFPPRDDSKPVFCSRFLYISYRFDLKCI